MLTIKRFAPLLRKNATQEDPSRVIITASIAGIGVGTLGENATFGYSASKAAALHLTRNLALELGPQVAGLVALDDHAGQPLKRPRTRFLPNEDGERLDGAQWRREEAC